jgi:hypothetical protein
MSAEQRIRELGLEPPAGTAPKANCANAARTGNLLFLAGKAPLPENGRVPKGRLGREFTTEDGYRYTRSTALDLLAVMRAKLGSLDKWRVLWRSRASSTPFTSSRTIPG